MFTLDQWKTIAETGAAIIAAASLAMAVGSYRNNVKLSRMQWTTSLAQDFLLNPKYEHVRYQLQMTYKQALDPFFQATAAGENAGAVCSEAEIRDGRAAADFLMHLELFCYLEKLGTLRRKDVDAMLGYWLDFFKRPELLAMQVFLQELGFENITERLQLRVPVNRIAVYGTLNPETVSRSGIPSLAKEHKLGEISIPGNLFDTGHGFPVAVLDSDNNSTAASQIKAQVFELSGSKREVARKLLALDDYEATSPIPSYRRVILYSSRGPVWFYEFTGNTDYMRQVPDGDWSATKR